MSKPDPKKPVKAIWAGIGVVSTWAGAALADGNVSTQEWWALGVGVVLSVAAVYGFKNPQVGEDA